MSKRYERPLRPHEIQEMVDRMEEEDDKDSFIGSDGDFIGTDSDSEYVPHPEEASSRSPSPSNIGNDSNDSDDSNSLSSDPTDNPALLQDSSASATELVTPEAESVQNPSRPTSTESNPMSTITQTVNKRAAKKTKPLAGSRKSSKQRVVPPSMVWTEVTKAPRLKPAAERRPVVLAKLDRGCTEIDAFLELFPNSLLIYISQCTNARIEILNRDTGSKHPLTEKHEIMLVLGVCLIMCYNRVPSINDYWKKSPSLGNEAIRNTISRDRFKLLMSKMYFNHPEKPDNASKMYYMEDIQNCLNTRFQRARANSSSQAIDESMAKFKGRSALKQYMPLKPIKRGIKIWERCDSSTGYTYHMNIYIGKDESSAADGTKTLGERVVEGLCSSIGEPGTVNIFCDRFFSSIALFDNLPYPAVGTCVSNRKHLPIFQKELKQRGDCEFLQNPSSTTAVHWKDTKQLVCISSCYGGEMTTVKRKMKNGEKKDIPCPEMLAFYNSNMGGVDLSDQIVGLYDFDRKSGKWWKKVFIKFLLTTTANAWIIFREVKNQKKSTFLNFLIPLAEELISRGREKCVVKRRISVASGRPSKKQKQLSNVGDHLPIEGKTRRRCTRCSHYGTEKRTRTICISCAIPLCKNCFCLYHQ